MGKLFFSDEYNLLKFFDSEIYKYDFEHNKKNKIIDPLVYKNG